MRIAALLLMCLLPVQVASAEPLPPAYYLPTDTEIPPGFVLTERDGPAWNQVGTAYQELRTYQRAAPYAQLLIGAGQSTSTDITHTRFAGLSSTYTGQGFTAIPTSYGDESVVLFRLDSYLDGYMLLWRSGAIIGTVQLVCASQSMTAHDAGAQMDAVAKPMLARMQTHVTPAATAPAAPSAAAPRPETRQQSS